MRYFKIISLLLFSMLEFNIAFSQSNVIEHPLDKEYQKCLQENLGNLGRRKCNIKFEGKWDEQMNRNYSGLIKAIELNMKDFEPKIDSTALLSLRASQRQWLKYRDSEFKLCGKLYSRKGSMWYTIQTSRRLELVKQRALELKKYRQSFQ